MDFRMYDNAIGRFYNIDVMTEIMPSLSPYRFGFNNPVIWKDPTGLLEDSTTDPRIETIHLNEVVVSANRRNNDRTYTRPSDFGRWGLANNLNLKRHPGNLNDYNKMYNTDFKSQDDWYYRAIYLPFEQEMYRSIHQAQNTAGKAVAALMGSVFALPLLAASPVVTSAVSAASPILSNMTYGGVSRYAGMQMTANAIGQGVGNGGDVTKINLVDVGASGLNGLAPLVVGSTFNVSIESLSSGKLINNSTEIGANIGIGIIGNGIMNKFQLPKSIMTDASFMTYQGMINTSVNGAGTLITNQITKD